MENIKLTALSQTAGCAAKIGPETLSGILEKLPKAEDARLLVGVETSDDAAVLQLNEEMALIQTLDFFTPVVDDPYTFGQVAAANALSDVYAMGGKPLSALNIVGFPKNLDVAILGEILRGGFDKVKEAGALLAGGHSIQDSEPKYGLSVSGLVHPKNIWRNVGMKEGDVLILTKPIGTGILNTCLKESLLERESYQALVTCMSTLNRYAAEGVHEKGYQPNACTDVTGFGLLGHLYEMVGESQLKVKVDFSKVPILPEAIKFAHMGIVPMGTYKNSAYTKQSVYFRDGLPDYCMDLLFDPQTSGGLLLSLPKEMGILLLEHFTQTLELPTAIIGEVLSQEAIKASLKNLEEEQIENYKIFVV